MVETTETAPTAARVDALVRKYSEAQAVAKGYAEEMRAANEKAEAIKAELVELVQAHGRRHTEKSKVLLGVHSRAMVTVGTRIVLDPEAVETFRGYLIEKEMTELAGRFFSTHVSYQLVDGPQEVLGTLKLGARIRNKMKSLLGLCWQVKTNAPSLKVELTAAEPVKAA